MFDFDLAGLYGVETKVLNQAVKRNIERFPKDFMFQLSEKEIKNLRSQFVTSSYGGRRYRPYVFTEHGVTMLANVLKSKRAIRMSIAIVRAFISLKQLVVRHKDLAERLEELRKEIHERLGEHDTQLASIYMAIENLLNDKITKMNWEERERIGFRK